MYYYLYILGVVILIIAVLIIYVVGSVYYRTLVYRNYLKGCDKKKNFCHIRKIKLQLPSEFIYPLMVLSENEGARIEIPRKKAQKNIDLNILLKHSPQVIQWCKSLGPQLSEVIGTPVMIAPLSQKNSVSLIAYDREGDFVDWHFDSNHYNGRYFTLLVPVSSEKTCGNYQYRDENEETQTVEMNLGESILFEGDKVFHRGKELCKDQKRVVLSMTFVTSTDMDSIESMMVNIKNYLMFLKL